MINILLPVYAENGLFANFFLKSWADNTRLPTKLLIYDNGKNCDLNKYNNGQNIIVIGDGKNIGLHAAYNKLMQYIDGDYFYLPHLDMYLLPEWDINLINYLNKNPNALACSRSVERVLGHTKHHKILDFGSKLNDFKEEELLQWHKNYLSLNESKIVESGARMPFALHKNLLKKMWDFNIKNNICDGPFDENYFSYCQDDDIIQSCYHLKIRKFHMIYGSLVYHLSGQSNQQQTVDRDSNQPYKYFIQKWRAKGYLDAEHPGQWHPKLIPQYVRIK